MSKIGKMPVSIPSGVDVSIDEAQKKILVKGPKGELTVPLFDALVVKVQDSKVSVKPKSVEMENYMAYWGTERSLLNGAIIGVSEGYIRYLEIVGVGYRANKEGNNLKIDAGYSHPVYVYPPVGITLDVEGNTVVKVTGIDKQLVGQVAANIRGIRSPEPYKGKGIRYRGELVRRKQGKASKK